MDSLMRFKSARSLEVSVYVFAFSQLDQIFIQFHFPELLDKQSYNIIYLYISGVADAFSLSGHLRAVIVGEEVAVLAVCPDVDTGAAFAA